MIALAVVGSVALVVGAGYRLLDRLVSIRERESAAVLAAGQMGKPTGKLPDDIAVQATQFAEEWARDAYLARASELYEKTEDWGQVRNLLQDDMR